MFDFAEYTKLLIALIAIIDIPGNVPVFLSQTSRLSQSGRQIAAFTAAVATALILLLFAVAGQAVLSTFGISIASFKVLGGLVVLIIALDMLGLLREEEELHSQPASTHGPVAIGIFPLAVPLFAGPGAITAVMVYAHEDFHPGDDLHAVIVVLVVLTSAAVLLAGLLLAARLSSLIGPLTRVVLNRLLGMIVGALGIEFVLEGLAEYFPAFAAG